jgi:hypothetical protein
MQQDHIRAPSVFAFAVIRRRHDLGNNAGVRQKRSTSHNVTVWQQVLHTSSFAIGGEAIVQKDNTRCSNATLVARCLIHAVARPEKNQAESIAAASQHARDSRHPTLEGEPRDASKRQRILNLSLRLKLANQT